MKGFIEEFKEFISRGNVMDMAVGIMIGGAFTAIVTSLVDDIISPILGVFGGLNFDQLKVSQLSMLHLPRLRSLKRKKLPQPRCALTACVMM